MDEFQAWHSWEKPLSGPKRFFLVFFGVMLPLGALLLESWSHVCADEFFNPIPTPAHAILVGLVPAVHLLYLGGLRGPAMRLAAGMAVGISALYSLAFVFLMPAAAFLIIYFGLGLLPLAPALSLASGCLMLHRLRFGRPALVGLLLALLAWIICSIPYGLTCAWMRRGDAASIGWLRRCRDEKSMLAVSNPRQNPLYLPVGWMERPDSDQCREIRFRVTGDSPNDLLHGANELAVSTPTVAGRVDAEAGVAELRWSLPLAPWRGGDRSGWVTAMLPPGALVHEVGMRQNGRRQMGRIEHGPVQGGLFSSSCSTVNRLGPDHLLWSCSDLPARPTVLEMSMSVPLQFLSPTLGAMRLPHALSGGTITHVALEGPGGLQGDLKPDQTLTFPRRDVRELTGSLPDGRRLVARLRQRDPGRVALVVDTSRRAQPFAGELGPLVEAFPGPVVVPQDEGPTLLPKGRALAFVGGQDNLAALGQALQTADTVVWLHGPQNFPAGKQKSTILQALAAHRVLHCSLTPEPQPLLVALQPSRLQSLPRLGTLAEDVARATRPALEWEFTTAGPTREPPILPGLARLWASSRQEEGLDRAFHLVTEGSLGLVPTDHTH